MCLFKLRMKMIQGGMFMDIVGIVNIELWAVVLGATDALLNLEMPYGYVLKRLKLKDTPLYNEVVNARGNLDIKYIASNLADERTPEFVFLCKTENNSMPLEYFSIGEMLGGYEKAGKYFDTITNKWNKEIFYILSMLRLTQEGNIEVADKIYKMKANYKCNNINRSEVSSQDSSISIYDDVYEWNNDNLTCFENMVGLPEVLKDELEDVMERFGRGYSASRYDDALRMYKERSNETHEGNNLNITKEALKELRCAVRGLVQNFISFSKSQYGSIADKTFNSIKREYIIGLLARINTLQTNGLLKLCRDGVSVD